MRPLVHTGLITAQIARLTQQGEKHDAMAQCSREPCNREQYTAQSNALQSKTADFNAAESNAEKRKSWIYNFTK